MIAPSGDAPATSWRFRPRDLVAALLIGAALGDGLGPVVREWQARLSAPSPTPTTLGAPPAMYAGPTCVGMCYLPVNGSLEPDVNIPTAAGAAQFCCLVKKTDAGPAVTLHAADLIDGASTFVLTAQYQSVTLYSDGKTWTVTP